MGLFNLRARRLCLFKHPKDLLFISHLRRYGAKTNTRIFKPPHHFTKDIANEYAYRRQTARPRFFDVFFSFFLKKNHSACVPAYAIICFAKF